MAESTCKERIDALENTIEHILASYNELQKQHDAMKVEYERKISALMSSLADLVVENDVLKKRLERISRDVQSITGRDLLQKKINP
jgi:archaellum component FlaC